MVMHDASRQSRPDAVQETWGGKHPLPIPPTPGPSRQREGDDRTRIARLHHAPRRPLDSTRVLQPRGQVYVIPGRCKGCKFCIEFCPQDVLMESGQMNAKGYHYPVVADGKEVACVNCGFCEMVCPEFAIYTRELAS